jgi:hypothetical protein
LSSESSFPFRPEVNVKKFYFCVVDKEAK